MFNVHVCQSVVAHAYHGRVQGSTSSPIRIDSRRRVFEVLWNLEFPVGLSQREICAHFNEGDLAQFGRSVEK